ncbi:MAG: hypothetical protein M0R69_06930 [Candidatus Cloacimonetes bacterium]|jgi:hypothetical protein|nr:hypothetical protein [Candidatus Cloacimonadota bacterium]
MVYIQRLALILLLLSAVCLTAQSFELPEEELDLPQSEPVSAAEDSLAMLISEEEIALSEEEEFPAEDFFAGIEKAEVIAYIDLLREYDYPDASLFDPDKYPNISTAYRFGSDFTGLQNAPLQVKNSGFQLPNTFFQSWYYLGYLAQFYQLEQEGSRLNAHHLAYEYPVSLSRLEGSLGDYDSHNVQLSFAKGNLFGFDGASMQFDYRLSNGYWVDYANSGSSIKQYLSYRFRDFLVEFDIASYQRETGSYELNPAYWHLGNFQVKNKYTQVIGHIQHPWLSFSLSSIKDRISGGTLSESWHSKSLQIAVERSFTLPYTQLDLGHEYRDLNQNYTPAPAYNQMHYEHKTRLGLSHASLLNLDFEAELLDWKRLQSQTDLSKELGLFRVGVHRRMNLGDHKANYEATSILDGALMPAVDIYSPWENSLYTALNLGDLNLKLAFGQKKEQQQTPDHDISKELMILRASGLYDRAWSDWRLRMKLGWSYQKYERTLMAAPEYTFISEQRLYRYLSHDNLLVAGFSLQGHSDYYLANAVNPYLIEASTAMDVFAGLRISKLFDLNVSVKNLLSTSIYGLYPIPLSIHANVRWFFIN